MSREHFAVRVTVNIDVEADIIPGESKMTLALALAEVVVAQALVQGTESVARTLPGTANVSRKKAPTKMRRKL